MKRKILSIIVIAIIMAMCIPFITFATTPAEETEKVQIKIETDKSTYNVGDKVTATIKWGKEAEAFGFSVKYDNEKLEFDSISVGKNFHNVDATKGEILCNWYSAEGDGKTNVEITFKSKVKGSAELTVSNAKGFSWVSDTIDKSKKEYTYTGKTIDIKEVAAPTPTNPDKPEEQKPEEKPTTPNKPEEQEKPSTTNKPTDTKTEEKTNTTVKPTETVGQQKPTETNKVPAKTNTIDKTIAGGKIPHAGAKNTVIIAIVIIAVVGTVVFVKYKELSEI